MHQPEVVAPNEQGELEEDELYRSAGNGTVIAGADVRRDFSRCSGGTPIECELRLRRN